MITLKSELEALKFDYEKKLQGLTEETSIFKQEAARRELDIELYINDLYNKLKVSCIRSFSNGVVDMPNVGFHSYCCPLGS